MSEPRKYNDDQYEDIAITLLVHFIRDIARGASDSVEFYNNDKRVQDLLWFLGLDMNVKKFRELVELIKSGKSVFHLKSIIEISSKKKDK